MLFLNNKVTHNFSVSDLVRVLPKEHIALSLDHNDKLDGCLFMPQMYQYCNQQFKIVKIVKNIYLDHDRKMIRCRAPFYLLKGLKCNESSDIFPHKCDRTCYLLWHEKWLEKI